MFTTMTVIQTASTATAPPRIQRLARAGASFHRSMSPHRFSCHPSTKNGRMPKARASENVLSTLLQ